LIKRDKSGFVQDCRLDLQLMKETPAMSSHGMIKTGVSQGQVYIKALLITTTSFLASGIRAWTK